MELTIPAKVVSVNGKNYLQIFWTLIFLQIAKLNDATDQIKTNFSWFSNLTSQFSAFERRSSLASTENSIKNVSSFCCILAWYVIPIFLLYHSHWIFRILLMPVLNFFASFRLVLSKTLMLQYRKLKDHVDPVSSLSFAQLLGLRLWKWLPGRVLLKLIIILKLCQNKKGQTFVGMHCFWSLFWIS